ncbi:MAG: hypothetical protein A2Y34_04430 [Spirochaetes bacterium GWC1_27_15]|nr:MAG: hypothetical protein A2Y34_04430 [Spirochaetes bacterium GWC1_27_15]
MIERIGLIPIKDYIRNLDLRNYGRSMIIEYTKEIYNLDLTNELKIYEKENWNLWNGDLNIYDNFDKENPIEEPDNLSRNYFEKHAKKKFIKFIKQHEEFQEDRILPFFKVKDIHHIFPLIYGGSNKISNLLYVSRFTHDLLHINPLENIEKYCYQACDYLAYLGWFEGFKYLNEKYDLGKYVDSKKLLRQMYKGAIEEEMSKFYEYIQKMEGLGQTG